LVPAAGLRAAPRRIRQPERGRSNERARFRKARTIRKDGEALHADPLQHGGRSPLPELLGRQTLRGRERQAAALPSRYLNNVKLSANEWLWVVKLFELETSATVIANETGISYPTALKAIDTIRCAIAEAPRSDVGPPDDCRETNRHGMVSAPNGNGAPGDVEPVIDDTILYHLKLGQDCLVLTERSPEYDYLVCRERKIEVVDHGRGFPRLRVYCSAKGFWPFAKERFVKYHGVSLDKLPGYLEEMSFRWLNRGTPLFDLILERLCHYAPAGTFRKHARAEQYVH
jgi:transposase